MFITFIVQLELLFLNKYSVNSLEKCFPGILMFDCKTFSYNSLVIHSPKFGRLFVRAPTRCHEPDNTLLHEILKVQRPTITASLFLCFVSAHKCEPDLEFLTRDLLCYIRVFVTRTAWVLLSGSEVNWFHCQVGEGFRGAAMQCGWACSVFSCVVKSCTRSDLLCVFSWLHCGRATVKNCVNNQSWFELISRK